MAATLDRIAELEWANYAAMLSSAEATPSLEVVLGEEVILTSSTSFPTPDSNHACLLQPTAEKADDLIDEVTEFYQAKGLPVAIYISPACTPSDLPQRLLERGFDSQPGCESWMVVEGLLEVEIPSPLPGIRVRQISKGEVGAFVEVFLTSFDLPSGLAPLLAQVMEPTIGLPDVHHYLALDDGQPVGTCSLLSYKTFGILGSAGVLPEHRGHGAATNLIVRAATDARDTGVDTVMLQTAADTPLERLLRISGFRREFTRSCYVLGNGSTG
ncbi:MAG: GNAT family N-acetyltransferase [Anaerolineae bacterium]